MAGGKTLEQVIAIAGKLEPSLQQSIGKADKLTSGMGSKLKKTAAITAGALLVQAHPYRKKCTPAIACYLEGLEVRNLNPRHENHNGWAEDYAAQFGLLRLGGSDCHRTEDIARGGICAGSLPEDTFQLAALLRAGQYALLGGEQA